MFTLQKAQEWLYVQLYKNELEGICPGGILSVYPSILPVTAINIKAPSIV